MLSPWSPVSSSLSPDSSLLLLALVRATEQQRLHPPNWAAIVAFGLCAVESRLLTSTLPGFHMTPSRHCFWLGQIKSQELCGRNWGWLRSVNSPLFLHDRTPRSSSSPSCIKTTFLSLLLPGCGHVTKFWPVGFKQKCYMQIPETTAYKEGRWPFLTPSSILLDGVWKRWLELKQPEPGSLGNSHSRLDCPLSNLLWAASNILCLSHCSFWFSSSNLIPTWYRQWRCVEAIAISPILSKWNIFHLLSDSCWLS